MAKTVADLMIERLIDWGVDTIFGFPGDGDQRHLRGAADPSGQDQVHSGAPRGGGCFRRLWLCQVHRPAGGVPGDLGTRRRASAERPLRRQVRRPTRAGHHGTHVPRPHQHALPAGRGPGQIVHGRGRLQRADHGAGPRPQRRGRGHQDRPFPAARWPTSPFPRTSRNGRPPTSHAPGPTSPSTAPTCSPPPLRCPPARFWGRLRT